MIAHPARDRIIAICLLLFLACATGCRTARELLPERVAKDSLVTRDETLKVTSVFSPNVRMRGGEFPASYQFAGKQADGSPAIYMFRIESIRPITSPAAWKEMFIDGRSMPFSETAHGTNSSKQILESVVVRLSRDEVEAMHARSLRVNVLGENGTLEFEIARPVPAGFLMRCQEILKQTVNEDPRFAPIR